MAGTSTAAKPSETAARCAAALPEAGKWEDCKDLKTAIEPRLYQGRLALLHAQEKALAEQVAQQKALAEQAALKKGKSAKPLELRSLPQELQDDLKKFAERKYRYHRTYNTLKDVKLRDRKLPLLELEVDANDYLPAMAILLSIMIAAVWLSMATVGSRRFQWVDSSLPCTSATSSTV